MATGRVATPRGPTRSRRAAHSGSTAFVRWRQRARPCNTLFHLTHHSKQHLDRVSRFCTIHARYRQRDRPTERTWNFDGKNRPLMRYTPTRPKIIKTKSAPVSLGCKSHRFKAAKFKIITANSKQRSYIYHSHWPVIYKRKIQSNPMRYHGRRWNPLCPHLAIKFTYKLVHFRNRLGRR